ncbi:MAG: hypothetical protein Q8M24_10295 [Pseudolabrys sp.]|nr:hypothetical protein [Pseudolabrys sp.]MDP2295837.1 hypothetical protein [Pseudolabrys sp.]
MTLRWLAIGFAAVGVAGLTMSAVGPAHARAKHRAPAACVDRPAPFSWHGFFHNGRPQPNGCAPAVIEAGQYVGQDPDANIRHQLRRDPNTGYTNNAP